MTTPDSAFFATPDDPLGQVHAREKLKAMDIRIAVLRYLVLGSDDKTILEAVSYAEVVRGYVGAEVFTKALHDEIQAITLDTAMAREKLLGDKAAKKQGA